MENPDVYIVSFLIACILLESYLSYRDQKEHYDGQDTWTNFCIALLGITANTAVKSFALMLYKGFEKYALIHWETNFFAWIFLFLLIDFHHYIFHVLSHKSRFFWAMHVIHHSSEKFNFTTAIRTPFTNSFFRFSTLAPLCLLGFQAEHIILFDLVMVASNFFQHTQAIGRLGWLEYILNTPSHHRVHHGTNPKYIDKNFGCVLIFWDKLFNTFQEEGEKVKYGITKPPRKNTVWQVLTHEWINIGHDILHADLRKHSLASIVFGSPAGPSSLDNSPVAKSNRRWWLMFLLVFSPAIGGFGQTGTNEHCGQLCVLSREWSGMAGRETKRDLKFEYAVKARTLAMQSINCDPNSKDIRLAHVIALGILSESAASPQEKVKNAKLIREEAEFMLKMDSSWAPPHYILGKWNYELSKLSLIEKMISRFLLGDLIRPTFESSLSHYNKAIQFQPNFILFRYAKACTLYEMGEYKSARSVLEYALTLPNVESDDNIRKDDCKKLLLKINENL